MMLYVYSNAILANCEFIITSYFVFADLVSRTTVDTTATPFTLLHQTQWFGCEFIDIILAWFAACTSFIS